MRLNLNRRSGLAISALRHLAQHGARMSTAELAAAVNTTASFLPKVMFPLVRQGWVRSVSGPGGGYELTAAARGASVLAVIEAVDGAVDGRECLVPPQSQAHEECPFHARWERAKHALLTELRSLRVTEGLDPPDALHLSRDPALSMPQKGTMQ